MIDTHSTTDQMHGSPHGHHSHVTAPSSHWWALVLLAVTQFMLVLDVTIVNVALPDLTVDIGFTAEQAGWLITAYALPFGGLMLIGGWVSDVVGSRRIFLLGLLLFTAASFAAGTTSDANLLLIARAMQGVGAALLSPSALATVVGLFEGAERQKALGVWGAIGAAGAAAGVLLGGLLTGGPGWRWIFYINVPIGIAVALLLPLVVTSKKSAGTSNTLGFFQSFSVLGKRPVFAGVLLMVASSALVFATFFLLSFILQSRLGWGATETGVAFLPIALGTLVGAHLVGHLASHFGLRALAVLSLIITAVGFGGAALVAEQALWLIAAGTVVALGVGGALVAATIVAMADAGEHDRGFISGLVNTFHELGGAGGILVLSAIAAPSIAAPMVNASGFAVALYVAAGFAFVAAIISLVLVPGGRIEVDPHSMMH